MVRTRALRRKRTDAEPRLRSTLRAKRLDGFKFRRQLPIGSHIADLACPGGRPIVGADGGQRGGNDHDVRRDAWLVSQARRVIRFWNPDILINEEGVLAAVLAALSAPLPNPSPARGEGLSGASHG